MPATNTPRTYTKRDIVKKIASRKSVGLNESALWVNYVLTALREIMMSPDPELRIEIRDFGVFEVKKTKSKPKARNPQTGEVIHVPAHRKTHFKPGKILKNFLASPLDPHV
jgi:integration host factor subunit beta